MAKRITQLIANWVFPRESVFGPESIGKHITQLIASWVFPRESVFGPESMGKHITQLIANWVFSRIRPEDLCRPNILPCQVFDIQKLSFQLNFVFDELGCQPALWQTGSSRTPWRWFWPGACTFWRSPPADNTRGSGCYGRLRGPPKQQDL